MNKQNKIQSENLRNLTLFVQIRMSGSTNGLWLSCSMSQYNDMHLATLCAQNQQRKNKAETCKIR